MSALPNNPLRSGAQIQGRLDQLAAEMALVRTEVEDAEMEGMRAEYEFKKAEAQAQIQAEGSSDFKRKADATNQLVKSGALEAYYTAKGRQLGRKARLDLLKNEAMVLMGRLRSETSVG